MSIAERLYRPCAACTSRRVVHSPGGRSGKYVDFLREKLINMFFTGGNFFKKNEIFLELNSKEIFFSGGKMHIIFFQTDP